MIIQLKLGSDAHRLIEAFIKYGKLNPEALSDAMQYDRTGFRLRLRDLECVLEEAAENG